MAFASYTPQSLAYPMLQLGWQAAPFVFSNKPT